jgi:hypothetical protein
MDAMPKPILYPRFVRESVEPALSDTPMMLTHGPRQCGKTTLARMVGDASKDSGPNWPQESPRGDIRPLFFALPLNVALLEHLPPWHSNRLSRLIKTPKLHIGDTGLAAAMPGMDAPALAKDRVLLGRLLETFLFQELKRQASRHDTPIQFHHFRDKDGVEMALVLERSMKVTGIEIKGAATVSEGDFRGLKKLRDATRQRFASGVVLYNGESLAGFSDRLYAIPLRTVWETT